MPLKTTDSGLVPEEAFQRIRSFAAGAKSQGQRYLAELQGGPVDSAWVFTFLDQIRGFISYMNATSSVVGLDAYATAQGYSTTLSTDVAACVTAAQACINWVTTNFPKDTTATWLLAFSLNSDGTRNMRSFTTAQTAGLQTALSAFVATFG